jgi:hypothetical protein
MNWARPRGWPELLRLALDAGILVVLVGGLFIACDEIDTYTEHQRDRFTVEAMETLHSREFLGAFVRLCYLSDVRKSGGVDSWESAAKKVYRGEAPPDRRLQAVHDLNQVIHVYRYLEVFYGQALADQEVVRQLALGNLRRMVAVIKHLGEWMDVIQPGRVAERLLRRLQEAQPVGSPN